MPSSGIVSFAPAETIKSVSISILNSGQIEPTRQFTLELISASGGAWLGNRLTCLVNLLDNSTPPKFTLPPAWSNGVFRAQITGATGLVARVERSTNLPNWLPFQSFNNTTGAWSLSDSNLPSRAFYRAVIGH